jgi:hypothetical protein
VKRTGRVIIRVAVLRASTTTSTTKRTSITTERLKDSFTSAFTLGASFGYLDTVGAAFFALGVVEFYSSYSTFLTTIASSLAIYSLAAFAFFLAFTFAFLSLSYLFLRAFAAL